MEVATEPRLNLECDRYRLLPSNIFSDITFNHIRHENLEENLAIITMLRVKGGRNDGALIENSY
jgi:hypothetical protein